MCKNLTQSGCGSNILELILNLKAKNKTTKMQGKKIVMTLG